MIVTFISQCQKKSLGITRRVLDAYANRIGERTWQTVITQEGLDAVRASLAATARKTSAIACHRMRGTHRTELVWIVGNRRKFDDFGNVPVNLTQRDLLKEEQENDWRYLPLIKVLVALAALFHDFGKSWDYFQKMLKSNGKSDPVRHEWISLLLFRALVANKSDELWLTELFKLKEQNQKDQKAYVNKLLEEAKPPKNSSQYPFEEGMTDLAIWVAWLIVTHHRLPGMKAQESVLKAYDQAQKPVCSQTILGDITLQWGYLKANRELTPEDWKFGKGLPILSNHWCKTVARWANKAMEILPLVDDAIKVERLLLTLSRLALMLGDHHYSSIPDRDNNWRSELALYANTGKQPDGSRPLKQQLDEHLVHVTAAALTISHLLPSFEKELPQARDVRALRKPSPPAYAWQNKAVQSLNKWRKENDLSQHGFFAINMASTGCGKTFANAKVMGALMGGVGLRYNLALGLRTLTLQTGDEYRNKLKLGNTELAVLIGSAAVRYLHEQRQDEVSSFERDEEETGSSSAQSLATGMEVVYESAIPEEKMSTVLRDNKAKKLLYAPVVVSTIDHLMPATEGVIGGRQILPTLRLMSADLVIDEVDDFDQRDLPAIARLAHLAGMLGRKVMISSATIPPAVAQGLFHAYQAGWRLFALSRQRKAGVTVFWLDEFGNAIQNVVDDVCLQQAHQEFIDKRIKKLNEEARIKRKAQILTLSRETAGEDIESRQIFWFAQVLQAAIGLHRQHAFQDNETGRQLSIGVIRMANVDPCIKLARYLLQCSLPDDVDIRVMPYHARQVLMLRSAQEEHLDQVLRDYRQNGETPQNHQLIKRHLHQAQKPHLVFILVATPVEEVGRDHDLDWAVIEPSSMRSIIQMAGRVLRHRRIDASIAANLVLPEYNLKGFIGREKVVFRYPGYESSRHTLQNHSLKELLDTQALAQKVDATPRIQCARELQPTNRLTDLEHCVLHEVLTNNDNRPGTAMGWAHSAYYLTQLSQQVSRFRHSRQDEIYKLHLTDDGDMQLRFADKEQGKQPEFLHMEALEDELRPRLWLELDYAALIEKQSHYLNYSIRRTCEFLGEVRLQDKQGEQHFTFTPELGFSRSK